MNKIYDAGLVALVFEKNFAMFSSILGIWLPIILIFLAVYLTGLVIKTINQEKN